MILAGDVGCTKVHLALYNMVEGRLILVRDFKFPAHEFASLEDVVNRFLSPGTEGGASDESERFQISAACFGVAAGKSPLGSRTFPAETAAAVRARRAAAVSFRRSPVNSTATRTARSDWGRPCWVWRAASACAATRLRLTIFC